MEQTPEKTIRRIAREFRTAMRMPAHTFKETHAKHTIAHINHIYDLSPFYRNLLKNKGIGSKEELPKKMDELSILPILQRTDLAAWTKSGEQMIPAVDLYASVSTSGTSGEPVGVRYSKSAARIGWGEMSIRALMLMGIDPLERGMMLTAYDPSKNISHSSHVNTRALKDILGDLLIDQPLYRPLNESLDRILSEDVRWIGTVPVFYNAAVMRATERTLPLAQAGIRKLFYGGVSFPAHLQEGVARGFNATIHGFYPSSEFCCAGAQVAKDSLFFIEGMGDGKYLLFNDRIHFEIVDEQDRPVREGETGRIIATPLHMDATPLVRYDIGDCARFEGATGNFMIVSDIRRANAIYLSNGKFHHHEVEQMQRISSQKSGITISGLQVAKVLGERDIELPVLRIETREPLNEEQKAKLSAHVIEAFKANEHVDMMIQRGIHGGIHPPVVEFYPAGALAEAGAIKTKALSDETDFWSSYAFFQNKITRHMSPIRELADNVVESLNGCKEVADLACGAGYFSHRLAQAGMRVHAVDANAAMLAYARRENLAKSHGDITFTHALAQATTLPSHSKNGVHISNLLCHVNNAGEILAEAHRILGHGGVLSLSEPHSTFDLQAIEKLKIASLRDISDSPEITPFFPGFVSHNQKMTFAMKALNSVDDMRQLLHETGFCVTQQRPTYLGTAYQLLAHAVKRAQVKKSITDISAYTLPIDERDARSEVLLDLNEAAHPPSPRVAAALAQHIAGGNLNRYGADRDLRVKLADYAGVNATEVLITNGSYQGIDAVFRALAREGDEVIIPVPTFEVFERSAALQGADIIRINHQRDGSLRIDDIIKALTEKTVLIALSNPNNPTGTLIPYADIQRLLRDAFPAAVLIDEAYFEFSGESCVNLISRHPNLIITRTFSKAFGLASMRIGYVLSNELTITELGKVLSPFDVNPLAQTAASAALDDLTHLRAVVSDTMDDAKPSLEAFLRERCIPFVSSAANFILAFPPEPYAAHAFLAENGIRTSRKRGELIGEGLRISIGSCNQIHALADALDRYLASRTPALTMPAPPALM